MDILIVVILVLLLVAVVFLINRKKEDNGQSQELLVQLNAELRKGNSRSQKGIESRCREE